MMTINQLILSVILVSVLLPGRNVQVQREHILMPAPASIVFESGRMPVTENFSVYVKGHNDARLTGGIDRMMRRLEMRTGFTFARGLAADGGLAALEIECRGPGKTIPALDEDETYRLTVRDGRATLAAPTVVGALHGLETFLQLLEGDAGGFFLPGVVIDDRPRFPWRGLMIDIARHWQPMEVLKRNIDGMAMVKLNVLHLHITEDQGFRIESKKYPKLHQLGSDGNFYTQAEMREVIEYCRMRGIRVIPEFDMPGHTTSWFVGHPELASAPGPYQIERKWGIFEPVLDPTNEKVYTLLDGFLGEMAALFPDPFLHIGGDEVEARHWKENPRIVAFIEKNGLKDNHGLQAYFNTRLLKILTKHGKRMIGWDEILSPELPKSIVIQSWRGPDSLAEAARKGYPGILSNGYYIDLMYPTRDHYLNDPIPPGSTMTEAERKLILGGEATMWSEWTSNETIDSRIWPRTAAIAERFWSPAGVRDVDDMYRRLELISVRLEDVGLLHEKNQPTMLRRLAGPLGGDESAVRTLKKLVDVIEPVKQYRRGTMQDATQFTPLTRIVDTARADSAKARELAKLADAFLYGDPAGRDAARIRLISIFEDWREAGRWIETNLVPVSPILLEAAPLARSLSLAGEIGIESFVERPVSAAARWRDAKLPQLDEMEQAKAATELVIVRPLREMVIAAAELEKRGNMRPEDWKKHIKDLAAPKKK
ncbi:MAG: family 20 glycosylhydrolase [Acidobacteriota bacterium]|nr:MAG: family 20 glycosylhydrolase [Acidobacteriota bacterium]